MSVVFLNHRTSAAGKGPPLHTSGRPLCPLSASQPGSAPGRAHWRGLESREGGLGSQEGGGAAGLPPSSSGPSPPGSWRDLCFSPVLRQKLPYECGSFPEPPAGETWEGTGSHPRGPPGSVLTVAQIDLVEDAGRFRSTVGPLWMRRVRGVGWDLPAGRAEPAGSQQVWEARETGVLPPLAFVSTCRRTCCYCSSCYFGLMSKVSANYSRKCRL